MKTHVIGKTAGWGGGFILAALLLLISRLAYSIVDTGQANCFDNINLVTAPTTGQPFYGQDAQFSGTQPSYTKSSDGLTVKDNVTGLTWQKSFATNNDGAVNKMTLAQAQTYITALNAANYGGYNDWRLPTIKELYSLITFAGIDPSGYTGADTSLLTPFIDRTYFNFAYGSTNNGGRIIDMNYASSTPYVYHTMASSPAQFGVNFADGRIKGYSLDMSWAGPGVSAFPVQLVRDAVYGANDFVDNGDSTITDRATRLMWTKGDSAEGLNWQEALAWAQTKNAENYLGHRDWRLPNAKELQSIVDYTRSPDTTSSAAIDPLFTCTGITNEAGNADFPFYWTSTTHMSQDRGPDASTFSGGYAVYVAFGRAMGYMTGGDPRIAGWLDVHGAGAQRSDPKVGNPADYPQGHGPQGDAIRIYNYVRLVRDMAGGEVSSVDFMAYPAWGKPPMTVTFTGSVTGTGENIIDWRWDFGDGEVLEGDEPNPKHVYADEGTYTVSLAATTPSGSTTVTKRNLILVSQSLPVSQPASLGAFMIMLTLLGICMFHRHHLSNRENPA